MRLGIVLCAIAVFTTIAKAQSNQGKTPMEYIEIAKFKLKEGFSNEQFIEAERAVRNGLIKTQKGFISRELSIDISGYWLMDMRFDTKDNMDAWFVVLKQDPTMKALGSMIDFQSVRMEFFNKQF
jgi:hypothetical protein